MQRFRRASCRSYPHGALWINADRSYTASSAAALMNQLTGRLRGHRVVHKLWAMLDDVRATARALSRSICRKSRPWAPADGADVGGAASGRHPVVNATAVVLPDWVDLPLPVAAVEKMAQQACAMTTGQAGPENTGRDLGGVRHLVRQLCGADPRWFYTTKPRP